MPEATQRQREIMVWVVWSALTASIVIYFIITRIVTQNVPPHALEPIIRQAFIVLSCAIAVTSFVVARLLLPKSDMPTSLARPPVIPFQRWFSVIILRLALHEAIAIFGLVLTFLSGDAQEMLPFGAAALVLNLFALPRNPPREG